MVSPLRPLCPPIAGILYQDMFSNNLSGTHVEMRSLWELVSSKLPRLAQHLQALKCDISILATDWFMCLFATTLPAEVRVCRVGGGVEPSGRAGSAGGCLRQHVTGTTGDPPPEDSLVHPAEAPPGWGLVRVGACAALGCSLTGGRWDQRGARPMSACVAKPPIPVLSMAQLQL